MSQPMPRQEHRGDGDPADHLGAAERQDLQHRASPLESKWLNYIADSLLDTAYANSPLPGSELTDVDKEELKRVLADSKTHVEVPPGMPIGADDDGEF